MIRTRTCPCQAPSRMGRAAGWVSPESGLRRLWQSCCGGQFGLTNDGSGTALGLAQRSVGGSRCRAGAGVCRCGRPDVVPGRDRRGRLERDASRVGHPELDHLEPMKSIGEGRVDRSWQTSQRGPRRSGPVGSQDPVAVAAGMRARGGNHCCRGSRPRGTIHGPPGRGGARTSDMAAPRRHCHPCRPTSPNRHQTVTFELPSPNTSVRGRISPRHATGPGAAQDGADWQRSRNSPRTALNAPVVNGILSSGSRSE